MTDMDGNDARPPRHAHAHVADQEYGLEEGGDEITKVGRRRQVIGILVRVVFYLRIEEDVGVLSVTWGWAGVAIRDHDSLASHRLDAVDIARA